MKKYKKSWINLTKVVLCLTKLFKLDKVRKSRMKFLYYDKTLTKLVKVVQNFYELNKVDKRYKQFFKAEQRC